MTAGQRISIVGPSGSGKTTLSKRLAATSNLPRLELDSLQHQANWTQLQPEVFRQRVRDFVAQDQWVIDGNYTAVGALDIIWGRADLVIWLDLPRWRTFSRVVCRTLSRTITREELWNGNREQFRELLTLDREDNFWLWVWDHHDHVRKKYERRTTEAQWSHLEVLRLRSPTEVERWASDFCRPNERAI